MKHEESTSPSQGEDDFKSQWNRPLEAFLPPAEPPSEREEMRIRSRFGELIDKVRTYQPQVDEEFLQRAFELAYRIHLGQRRRSKDPYITHPLEVAHLLTEIQVEEPILAAALLHDTVEDCCWDYEKANKQIAALLQQARSLKDRAARQHLEDLRSEVEKIITERKKETRRLLQQEMGEKVAELVEGVTRLTQLEFRSEVREQAENLRRLLVATAKDVRVLLVKLADRLHNMRTIRFHPSRERRLAIARETETIYAPLAQRLGISRFKVELEDRALEVINPVQYGQIKQWVERQYQDRAMTIKQAMCQVRERLLEQGIPAEVTGRAKHIYSIYQKQRRDGRKLEEILDLVALRIIVDTEPHCYQVVGVVHGLYPPMEGQFYDYIARPKPNNYQSIHTKVLVPDAGPLEIQIRTREMHENAEYGIAAHWRYKSRGKVDDGFAKVLTDIGRLLQAWEESADQEDLFNQLAQELLSQTIFVFTPKGEVVTLPVGASPVDFAYSIHTQLGHECITAYVNGQVKPLSHQLQTNDIVDIQRRKGSGPSLDWLQFVKTAHARNSIRAYLRRQGRQKNIQAGREALEGEATRKGSSLTDLIKRDRELVLRYRQARGQQLPPVLDRVAQRLSFKTGEDLLAAIGVGEKSAANILNRLQNALSQLEQELGVRMEAEPARITSPTVSKANGKKATIVYQRARCCHPVPGDDIMAYITRGHGMTIHGADCPNLRYLREREPSRVRVAKWDEISPYLPNSVPLRVQALDRPGLTRDLASVIAEMGLNILLMEVESLGQPIAAAFFLVEVPDRETVKQLVRELKSRVREVQDVQVV